MTPRGVRAVTFIVVTFGCFVLGFDGPAKAGHYVRSTRDVLFAQAPPQARLLVMPFENLKRETPIFWLGEASAVLLADDLGALGAVAITREERRHAFERLQVPAAAVVTDATVIRIGELVGATDVIVGSFEVENETLVVRSRNIALEAGRVTHDFVERGPMPDMFATFERIARRLASSGTQGASTSDAQRQHPPITVFENYIKGILAGTPMTAIRYLDRALTELPSYDRARLALWDIYAEQGDHTRALAAVERVSADSPLARRAKFLAGLSSLHVNKYDEAFAAFKALADARPTPTLLNNIGVVQLRRGSTPQTGLPTFYFNQAVETDPNDADYFFNLGYAYWMARDTSATIYWLREAVRRNPADGEAHFVLGVALAAGGNATESLREKELARRLSSTYEQWEKRPPAEAVPKGLERIKDDIELPHARRVDVALATSEQRDQRELARFYLDRGRRLFAQDLDREAIGELNRVLFLSPYEAEAHLLVGRIHLRNNRVREAIDAFKIAVWSTETAAAHVALGEAYLQAKDPIAARAEADRAVTLDPTSSDAKQLVERTR